MTAWQDQPPLSRRQLRESERGAAAHPVADPLDQESFGQIPAGQAADASSDVAGAPREGWEAEARRAPTSTELMSGSTLPTGRRVQLSSSSTGQDANLNAEYDGVSLRAPVRPLVPTYEAPSFRDRSITAIPPGQSGVTLPADVFLPHPLVPPQLTAQQHPYEQNTQPLQQALRAQQVTPDGPEQQQFPTQQRLILPQQFAAPASTPGASQQLDQTNVPATLRTITANSTQPPRGPATVVTTPIDPAPVESTSWQLSRSGQTADSVAFGSDTEADRPLTRRELRARGLGGFTAAIPVQDGSALQQQWAQPAVAASLRLPEFQGLADSSAPAVLPDVVIAEIESRRDAARFENLSSGESTSAQGTPGTFEQMLFPGGSAAGNPVSPPEEDLESSLFSLFGTQEVPAEAAVVTPASTSFAPPVGHWSTQANIDDTEQVLDAPFGRDVAATSGAITTSALVLPSVPTAEDIMGPLSGTGEILITGSINLPSSMGSTGVQPARYDHSDVDALLEADDREDSHQDSAPVRAIRAISTATAAGDVVASMKPRKTSKWPIIITIAGSVLIVGVIVLLVIGASLGFFK